MTIELESALDQAKRTRTLVAGRIATEVRHGQSMGQAKITKVTSLLHAFRSPGGRTSLQRVIDDLNDHGVAVDSGWTTDSGGCDIQRTGVLTLSSVHEADVDEQRVEGDPTIRLSIWRQGEAARAERPLTTYERVVPTDVLWFDIDPPVSTRGGTEHLHRAVEDRVLDVAAQLEAGCPGLTEEMVRDLLRQDLQPKLETYGDELNDVRGVSVVAVVAREAPGGPHDSDGVSEELVFQMVEMVVGSGWIVTCWHPSRVFTGTHEAPDHSLLREPFLTEVGSQWLLNGPSDAQSSPQTASDVGLYLARALVNTFGASHRMMERWVASWEVDFYRLLASEHKAVKLKESANEISNLLSMVGEFRRRLTAFQHARWSTSDRSWFPDLSDRDDALTEEADQSRSAKALGAAVDSAGERFSMLSSSIRADMDLLMLQSAATQQESTELLQGYLGKVTGLVLVPTLVVGLFGANTRLPGGGSWMGFELMVVLMVLSAVAVYLLIRKLVEQS